MIPGLRLLTLNDQDAGTVLIAHAVPTSTNPLGTLQGLAGTLWEPCIPIVPESLLQTALRGYAMPLMRVIGPHPHMLQKKIASTHDTVCAQSKTCPIYKPRDCFLNKKQPDCYEYPCVDSSDLLVTVLIQCWKEGRYVIGSVPN